MSLILPTDPPPASMLVALVSTKNTLVPATGGDEQELQRKGSKYALTYSMPFITYVQSMDWDDLMAEGDLVQMLVYQPGFDTGSPGAPRVNGSGQAGTSLVVDGLTPNYVVRKGQFLNITTGSQIFLYRAKAEVVANSSGQASIPLRTLLRRPPADNDVINLADPVIEGFVRDLGEWSVGIEHLVSLRFTVRERE